jgi:hypothetical protein
MIKQHIAIVINLITPVGNARKSWTNTGHDIAEVRSITQGI